MGFLCSHCRRLSSEVSAIGPCTHDFCQRCRNLLLSCPLCYLSETPSNERLSNVSGTLHPSLSASLGMEPFGENVRRVRFPGHFSDTLLHQSENTDVGDVANMFTSHSCFTCKKISYSLSSLDGCVHGLCPQCASAARTTVARGTLSACPFCQMDELLSEIRKTRSPLEMRQGEYLYEGFIMKR